MKNIYAHYSFVGSKFPLPFENEDLHLYKILNETNNHSKYSKRIHIFAVFLVKLFPFCDIIG